MPTIQTRRRFLTTLSLAGAASLVRAPPALAAEGALETTTVRFAKYDSICIAPEYVADELLRAEGFTDIRYVDVPENSTSLKAIAGDKVDFTANSWRLQSRPWPRASRSPFWPACMSAALNCSGTKTSAASQI